jgi:hypothetical protein
MALSLRRALELRPGGRGVDEVAGAAIGRPGRDEVVRGPVRRYPPRRTSRLARVPRPVHSSARRAITKGTGRLKDMLPAPQTWRQ